MFGALVADVRFAGRMLRKTPIFTVVAVLCISLGSGAVTTIFSAMNAIVLRPLPGASDPDGLVALERRSPDGRERVQASYALYEQLRDRSATIQGLAAWSKVSLAIGVNGEGHAVYGNIVSGNYFSVLGLRPALGRFFLPEEGRTLLTHPVIVVAYPFWKSHLGGDAGALGRTLSVNGRPYTLIGVAPPGFRGVFTPLNVEAWVPLMMQPHLRPGRNLTHAVWLWTFGRLAPGATRDSASQELTGLISAYAASAPEPAAYRAYNSATVSRLTGLPSDARIAFLGFAGLFLAAGMLVLLIASVNVSAMLSARAVARRREMAVRVALGASRRRLVGQMLTEVLLLFLAGSFGAVLLTSVATRALERLPVPGDTPLILDLSPDGRVLAFALLTSLAAGLVFGLGPAFQAVRTDVTTRLRNDSGAVVGRRTWLTDALIVGQLALSLLLLVAAGLFARAIGVGARVDQGFTAAGVAVTSLNPESWGYDDSRARTFYASLRERVAAIPGVTDVGFTGRVPLTMSSSGDTIAVDDADVAHRTDRASIQLAEVDPEYFSVLRIPILRGRGFNAADDAHAPNVAVVNDTFARRFWPDGSAVGRTFGFRGDTVTIVGIARDAKYADLSEPTPAFAYFPMPQLWRQDQTLLVRCAGNPRQIGLAVQQAVLAMDPLLPRPTVIPLEEATSIVLLPHRAAVWITGVLGALGLLLAAVGLYGMMALSAARRTREIGVRVALGAQRSDVLTLIVGDGMWLAGLGAALGLALSAAATRLIGSLLFGVSPLDLRTFAGMSAFFVLVALVASWLPARRAAAVDPIAALRSE